MAKLTDTTVRAIRDLRKKGVRLEDIARRYLVSLAAVSAAATRRTWKHVA